MTLSPCIECGEPADGSHCTDHQPETWQRWEGSARARGYDNAWGRLSKRARKLQPWCSDCGTTANLSADHLPQAWERKAAGKPIRLQDIEVVCLPCNVRRGSSRPDDQEGGSFDPPSFDVTRGETPHRRGTGPRGEAFFRTETGIVPIKPGVGR